jgi:hypothetical protein
LSNSARRRVPVLLLPFYAVWRLLTLILSATGRLLAAVVGLALVIVGLLISATVVGAPIGIPLGLLGFLLLLRSVF